MALTDDVAEVLVRNLPGRIIFGPRLLSRATAVAEVRRQLLEQRRSKSGVDRVVLVCGALVLQDETAVEGERLECTALFEHEEISDDERRQCISRLPGSWRIRQRSARMRAASLSAFSAFSEAARADAEVVKQAVHCNWACLEVAHSRFRGAAPLVSKACEQNADALGLASTELRGNVEFMLRMVRRDGRAMRFATQKLCLDRSFLLEALWRNQNALHHVAVAVPDDILMLIAEDLSESQVLESIDRDEALMQVRADGLWLATAVELQADKEIVMAAVEQNPNALRFTALTDDRDVVLQAVRGNGKMLEFASEELRRDHEVVLAAIRSNPRAREFAIDTPLFDVSDSDSASQVAEAELKESKRGCRAKRSGKLARTLRVCGRSHLMCATCSAGCGCSLEP